MRVCEAGRSRWRGQGGKVWCQERVRKVWGLVACQVAQSEAGRGRRSEEQQESGTRKQGGALQLRVGDSVARRQGTTGTSKWEKSSL